ncbi:ATP-binding protein [Actinacidiphila bryophytorum]|uniref:ATP-binding protein n=1 Tax=Actinacidiphila bryophytorum TaxID=1436133 RepID=UPI002176AC8B|nr:ATP-binding protein [Actinacidiphila bryophytorum]UWE10783.1 ATP-binding protein [Actinacidiphila bryophytorum]
MTGSAAVRTTDDAVVAGTPAPEPKVGARHTGWLTLPLAEPSARTARLHTRTALREWRVLDEVVDCAELVVSELVTNAVRHTVGCCCVDLRLWMDAPVSLVIAVRDDDPRMPCPAGTPDDTAESGRGLTIVAGMCQRHGCALAHDHKTMWAALALRGTAL